VDNNLEDEYRIFSRGPVGADLIAYLDQERDSSLEYAQDTSDPMKAVSLLQKASAYKTIKSYILRMSTPEE
jgi:hypothetical protein